ncbi:MAG TPA: restriction endonuclease [Nitrospiraceae bacterium]|nr:restriction endonuclease [Nitrospiraceae bacterium]
MPIPEYQKFFLPVLKIAGDGKNHSYAEMYSSVATEFKLTEEDRAELLPSGTARKFENRVAWAITYLSKARLLDRVSRGIFRISERDAEVLKKKPVELDNKFLRQFPEFLEFARGTKISTKRDEDTEEDTLGTPYETLEEAYQSLRRTLAQELLDRVRACSPQFFERLVVDLLVAIGYGGSRKDAGQAVGRSGDGGIDGIIKEDKLGLDAIYIQAKRWEATVGRPTVQEFAGSLEGHRARKGVLITTSKFSQDAKEYVGRIEKKIVLVDGEQLAQLMIDHKIGVTEVENYWVHRVDSDYFEEG